MATLTFSDDAIRGSSCLIEDSTSPTQQDRDLCDKLHAYLDCRSRNVDPPAVLSQAWDDLYAAYTPRIRAFLRRYRLSDDDREDCLQDVWGELISHLADRRHDSRRGRLSTWLMTVARNKAVDTIRRQRYCARPLEDATMIVDPSSDPPTAYALASTEAQMRSVLTELSAQVPALNFQVFYQRTVEGRSGAEVADALGLKPNQVRFRLHRTRRKFRDLFEQSADADRPADACRPLKNA